MLPQHLDGVAREIGLLLSGRQSAVERQVVERERHLERRLGGVRGGKCERGGHQGRRAGSERGALHLSRLRSIHAVFS